MRDDAALRAGFEHWWRECSPEVSSVEIDLGRPKAGLSSETLFLDVRTVSDDGTAAREAVVVRVPPQHGPLFPDYSLERLARTQNALAATDVPVPPATLVEDERWIGSPFLTMPRVEGRVLGTRPSYAAVGWLHDASDAERARLFDNLLVELARIHRLDFDALALGPLSGGGPALSDVVEWWREYLEWAAEGAEIPPEYAEGLDWCAANVPDAPPTSVLWGDAQVVNAVFDDAFGVAAVLDWEMASYGPGEVDLAWFLGLHELTVASVTDTEAATFPRREQSVARYQDLVGRPVADLHWYDVLAQVRSGAIVCRIGLRMDPDARWLGAVPQIPKLRELLGTDA